MPKIFISYRRADSQYVTDSIYDHMVSHFGEDDVFLDVGSIPFRVDFREYLRDQIADHEVILVVMGQDWARIMQERTGQSNDFVRIEIENALAMNKLIIPVLVKNASMPDFSKLPASISDLQWRNSAIIRRQPDLKNDCQRLADGIKQYLKSQQKSEKETTSAPIKEKVPSPAKRTGRGDSGVRVESILPAPFAWIDIPAGNGTMKTSAANVVLDIPNQPYSISKYPITNAQFRKFIDAGGYKTDKWWTKEGLKYRNDKNWIEPRYWTDSKWDNDNQPVVGVSWYESVAFCLWLSDVTNENIMLPTEDQWQFAAQGTKELTYPWGNDWDCKRCNNSVNPCDSNVTTPVTQYEGKGDSPFGIVDMAGNVWEWCLTDYENKTNNVYYNANTRVLRGGSWGNVFTDYFRADFRNGYNPYDWNFVRGFRISRS